MIPNLRRSVASASKATFRIYAALSDTDSVSASLYPLTGSWSASTLTWSTRPAYTMNSPLGVVTATSTVGAWKEVDVTSHVRQQLATGIRLVSFALRASASSVEKLILRSSEAAANRPELVVTP